MVITGWNALHKRKNKQEWCDGASKYDGLWRCVEEEVKRLEERGVLVEIKKVKARRTRSEMQDHNEEEKEHWEGNRIADEEAKAAGHRGGFTKI